MTSMTDLEETGLAFLHLKNGAEKAIARLTDIRSQISKEEDDILLRMDLLNVILILREALE